MEALKAQGEKPTPRKVEEILKPVLASREIASTLEAIRVAGGEAEYLQADVTDAEALKKIGPVVDRLGDLAGLIHGAGVLADRLIEKKTVSDFQSVYSTKVKGLEALLRSVDNSRLKYLILFSSAAGFFGNPGQSDYSMANEILNKVAYQFKRRHPDCRVRSFNWGPWDGGMVSDSLKKLFEERNVQVIPIEGGTKVFVEGFCKNGEDSPQVLVGSSMRAKGGGLSNELKTHRMVRRLNLADNPFLQDHVIAGSPVLPTVCVVSWMSDACEQLYPGYRFFRCDDFRTLKGIVFSESVPTEYIMDIEEVRKADQEEVEFEVKISRHQQPREKLIPCYRARIRLLRSIPEAPFYEQFDGTEREPLEGQHLYQDGTLFHGPLFQAVERVVNMSPKKLTMRCCVPTIEATEQGQFPIGTFNPYAADAQFQSMLIWVRKYRDAGSLPSKALVGEQYRPIPRSAQPYVSLDVKSVTRTRMVADVTTHDDAGKIYTRILDAEVTISKKLNALFGRATSR
jgi:NADP-dependent 3-hydroxy acid dehydrogenase YdfG